MSTHNAAAADVRPKRRRTTVNTTLSAVFLLLLIPLGLLTSWFGGTLPVAAHASDVCSTVSACHAGELGVWLRVATVGPWVAAAAGFVATAILWARRLLSFWVPLIAAALMICTVVAAYVAVILTMPA